MIVLTATGTGGVQAPSKGAAAAAAAAAAVADLLTHRTPKQDVGTDQVWRGC